MNTTHTAGPLLVEDGTLTLSAPPRGARPYREPVASVPHDTINAAANARRIAAAWNACAGIPTEALAAFDLRALLQRCESFLVGFEDDEMQDGVSEMLADLRRVIALT